MEEDMIEYKSPQREVSTSANVLETNTTNGVTCVWSGKISADSKLIEYSWSFDWDELNNEGVGGFSGHILVKRPNLTDADSVRIDFDLTENDCVIEKVANNRNLYSSITATFDYCLTPKFLIGDVYEEMFAPSEQNDGILIIEGKKLHVNKSVLSLFSEYFRALFSSNYREGQMNEIPIEDVSFNDFALLLSIIYPKTAFPNDKNAEKLLKLADRFMIPSVINVVEHHLSINSKIRIEKMMWMADKYGMTKLLTKTVRQMNTVEIAKKLEQSPEYSELSDKVKALLFDRLIKLV